MGWANPVECAAAFSVQVATHLGVLPLIWICWRLRYWDFFVVGWATFVTSILYHVCEVFEATACYGRHSRHVLRLTCGQWHRLDNVFAILSLQLLCVHLVRPRFKHTHWLAKMLPWSAVAITTWAQEAGPWKIEFTIVPIAIFALPVVIFPPRMSTPWWWVAAAVCASVAAFAFVKGLDDGRDYLRMWHGLWHIAASALSLVLLLGSRFHQREHFDEKHD